MGKRMENTRIVVKVGTSTLTYENGRLNIRRVDKLCKVLSDLQNSGKEIVLVSSGAIGVGVGKLGLRERPVSTEEKQAVAAVGQCELMFMYDKLFGEYNHTVAQVLLTRDVVENDHSKQNVVNTLETLLRMGIIPVVNENDTVATYELELDNDTLSAIVAALIGADLLILLSDIDGLYTDDPRQNPDARFIDLVEELSEAHLNMGKKSTGSSVGTGGMNTKLTAAQIATRSGADMLIANSRDVRILHRLMDGQNLGTLFVAHRDEDFDLPGFVSRLNQ